jgi:hypothetical protein
MRAARAVIQRALSQATGYGLTVTLFDVPVIEPSARSVAVTVCVPAVLKVTLL